MTNDDDTPPPDLDYDAAPDPAGRSAFRLSLWAIGLAALVIIPFIIALVVSSTRGI
jgi:hypothetical protein